MIKLLPLHINSNEPMIQAEMPIIGFCYVKCLEKHKRNQADTRVVLNCIYDEYGKAFETEAQIKSVLSPAECALIVSAIRKVWLEWSPDLQEYPEQWNRIKALIIEDLKESWLDAAKLEQAESPNDFYGCPMNSMSDVRFLIWRLAQNKKQERMNRG